MKNHKKTEQEFMATLQSRASEQRSIMQGMLFPNVFKQVSIWLGEHPWRILIPISLILSFLLHIILKESYDNLILKIFGGFGFIKLY